MLILSPCREANPEDGIPAARRLTDGARPPPHSAVLFLLPVHGHHSPLCILYHGSPSLKSTSASSSATLSCSVTTIYCLYCCSTQEVQAGTRTLTILGVVKMCAFLHLMLRLITNRHQTPFLMHNLQCNLHIFSTAPLTVTQNSPVITTDLLLRTCTILKLVALSLRHAVSILSSSTCKVYTNGALLLEKCKTCCAANFNL